MTRRPTCRLAWLGLVLLTGCGSVDHTDDPVDTDAVVDTDVDSEPEASGDPELGRAIFEATCAQGGCHGADGVSGPAPDLPDVVSFYSDERLSAVIQNGAGRMPGQPVTDEELADLLAYLRLSFP